MIRRARRPKRLPLVISLFLASLLGAPSAAVGTVATISPATPSTTVMAVQAAPDAAAEPAGHPIVADRSVPAVSLPTPAVRRTAARPGAVRARTDQALLAVRVPRGPPLSV